MADAPVLAFDPRVTPARPELAASHLAGKVKAARFVSGRTYEVGAAQAPVRSAPSSEAALDTETLRGERVTIYDTNEEGWAWGQLEGDGYVGFIPAGALRELAGAPTHKVATPRTLVFPAPSIKLPPLEALPFGARLAIAGMEEAFAAIASGGFVPARHLVPIGARESDFVAVAERFLEAPYLWGGKTNFGLDCSGLVQIALAACAIPCPRDSDMQERALGEPLAFSRDLSDLRRGDLLFWNGHVAIIRDHATLLHASAFHMSVILDPIAEAIPRIRAAGCEVTSVRRISQPR